MVLRLFILFNVVDMDGDVDFPLLFFPFLSSNFQSFVDEEESSEYTSDYEDEADRAARQEREERRNRFVAKDNRMHVDIPGQNGVGTRLACVLF
jgi:hypothetical protein